LVLEVSKGSDRKREENRVEDEAMEWRRMKILQ
jgi:hypothetical protein